MSINVNGIKGKLRIPEFLNEISQFNIVCLQEIKINSYDIEHLENTLRQKGLTITTALRSNLYSTRSGGLAIIFKSSLDKRITVLRDLSTSCFQSIVIDRSESNRIPLLIGNVYVPPVNSKYTTLENF